MQRLGLKLKRNSNDELAIQPCSCILEPKSGLGGEREVFPFPMGFDVSNMSHAPTPPLSSVITTVISSFTLLVVQRCTSLQS